MSAVCRFNRGAVSERLAAYVVVAQLGARALRDYYHDLVRSMRLNPSASGGSTRFCLSRRSIAALVLPSFVLPSRPAFASTPTGVVFNGKQVRVFDVMSAVAGPGGFQGPAGAQLGRLAASSLQLETLIADFEDTKSLYKGTEEDSIVVLRLSAIYFKESPALMRLTLELMPLLEQPAVDEANTLIAGFEEAVQALEAACRTRDSASQLKSARRARENLSQYLAVAGTKYTVPKVDAPYSSFRP